ncbi:MAG: hypothetical protein LBQ82_04560 [Treponema sp.]|jgi:hypothetical protein|nr:hypothetical protein [Treponema sp.]
MKKVILCIFFIIVVTKTNAENIFDFSWNFGNIGIGINYSAENDDNFEFYASLLNFTIEQKDINIGFEFSPVKFWYLFGLQDETDKKYNGERFSFINVNIYWDLIENKNIILGPFVSMNYLYVNTFYRIDINEYVFSGGLRFSYKLKHMINFNKYNSQILSTEIGYRNIFGKNKFYFSVNVDVILGLIGIGEGIRSSM